MEPVLAGREVTCGILGEEALPPILIEPVAGDFFDYESKYAKDGAREICPAPINEALTSRVQELALAAHKALGLSGYSRADFILGPDDSLTILEVNTLPGMMTACTSGQARTASSTLRVPIMPEGVPAGNS